MRTALAWAWVGVIAVASAVVCVTAPEGVVSVDPAPVLFTALGAIIVTRRPGNRVAWILLLIGAGLLIEPAAVIRFANGPPERMTIGDVLLLNGLNTSFFTVFILPLGLLLFIFPTGTFLTRRWRWAGWAVGISMAGFLSGIFSKVIVLATPEASWSINNPIGFLPESVNPVLNYVYGIPMITVLVVGVFALIIRFRRSDEAVRAQIKWVSLSLIVFVVTLLFRFATYPGEDLLSQVLFSAATAFIPVSMTLGILRYRLFDIDRLISRTVGYVVVVAALGSVYVLGAVWLPSRLLGEQPTLFVAGSTLAVAALFNPVRNRVLAWVDRRFYRSQYDAQRVVDDFTGRLRNRLDVEQLISESMSVVAEVMHPSAIAVWVVDQTVE
jgi:hypothetical protein